MRALKTTLGTAGRERAARLQATHLSGRSRPALQAQRGPAPPTAAGIWIALLNAAIAFSTTVLPDDYGTLRIVAFLSFAAFGVLVARHFGNLFYLVRTLFLGVIGYYPMAVKVLVGPEALFSHYEARTQGLDIVIVMYLATTLALLGNEIGLMLGSRHKKPDVPSRPPDSDTAFWRTIFFLSVPLVVVISVMIIRMLPFVFDAPYASGTSQGHLLGNTHNIAIIALLAAFVASAKVPIRFSRPILIFLSLLLLVYAMFLHGLRQDVVTTVIGLVVCAGLVKSQPYRLTYRNVGAVLLFVVAIEFMGVARTMLSAEYMTLGQIWDTFTDTLFESSGVYHFSTVSPMATTFSNMVFLIDSGTLQPLMGVSFLEWIPRTPPEFMYPNRPRDYAWIFGDYSLTAGGGIFELAEAYMNFGMMGALIVPAALSYLMARAFNNALYRQTVTSYFLLFTFLGMFMRGTWYQIFAFYKSFWTAIILLACFYVAHLVLSKSRNLRAPTSSQTRIRAVWQSHQPR